MFVSPSNPTGSVYTPEETKAIGEWALAHGIWVVSDEIYQNLVYEGARAVSIVDAVPELAGQTILVNGVAKTYAMTGWRVGWMVGPADAIKLAGNLQSHLSSNVNNVAQRAALAALTGPQTEAEDMRQAFDRRRRLIVSELAKIPGVTVPNPLGAFYVYPDVTGLLGREWNGTRVDTSLELADLILDQAEVAVVPGEAFGPSGYLRLSYALGDDQLLEGVQRLQKLFASTDPRPPHTQTAHSWTENDRTPCARRHPPSLWRRADRAAAATRCSRRLNDRRPSWSSGWRRSSSSSARGWLCAPRPSTRTCRAR